MPWPYRSATATIANGASLSDAVSVGGALLCGLLMPSAWTAADLTFQASLDGVTYADVYDDQGIEYTAVASSSRYIAIDPSQFSGATHVKIRSGTAAAAVTQGASRALGVGLRDIT